jgi:hypothetical protein
MAGSSFFFLSSRVSSTFWWFTGPQILVDAKGVELDAATAAKTVYTSIFDSTLVVIIGGFTIAAAISRYA